MNINKLELSFREFDESEGLDLPDGSLLKVATEKEQHQNWTVLQDQWFQPQEHLLIQKAPELIRLIWNLQIKRLWRL